MNNNLRKNVTQVLYSSIEKLNETLDSSEKILKSLEEPLIGENSKLDSMGLISLIVQVEEDIEEKLQKIVTLADEKALSRKNSPYKNISSLVDFICDIISEEKVE